MVGIQTVPAGIKRITFLALISVVPLLAQTGGFDWHISKPFPRPSIPSITR